MNVKVLDRHGGAVLPHSTVHAAVAASSQERALLQRVGLDQQAPLGQQQGFAVRVRRGCALRLRLRLRRRRRRQRALRRRVEHARPRTIR
eukprot:353447-Chlamydomonas_euryale.AAC.9